jgi:hypothetical protein
VRKSPNDLVRILAAGGGMMLDAGSYSPDQLVQFAAAAGGAGCTLILQNSDQKSPNDLVNIGAAGRGRVIFLP